MQGYCFELITGPMSCGKTEELLRRIKRSIIAKKKVKVISPQIDTREQGDYIKSRNGLWLDAVKVKHSIQILSVVKDDDDVVAIDELQFFDSNIVKFTPTKFNNFSLGYTISIHKSQGSEFDTVIIPVLNKYSNMLYKKLIYTATTRAKKKLILVGEIDALKKAIYNDRESTRKTNLKEFLKDCIK